MKNFYPYIIATVVLIAGIGLYLLFRASECQGSECDISAKDQDVYLEYKEMNPKTLESEVGSKNIFLLDVREVSEWQEGHIRGASHLPLGEINKNSTKGFPKDKPIYVYCRSGKRAGEAVTALKNLGFENSVNIGGINHYIERGGTLEKY